jgi:alpha-N-arabinofuranosidase
VAPAKHADVVLHPGFAIGRIDPRLFGSFVEHVGRGVYGGIYDPTDLSADDRGFRTDVLKLTRELGVTTVRYPGGNFVSAYDWRDGIGPRDRRPARLDPAWHSIEPNAFGVDEFLAWCRSAAVEPMMAVNLGSGDLRSALHLLEYLNHPGGTTLSDARRGNGAEEPYGVRMWCLGNEMDGPWQIGRKDADEYGRLAAATGAAMRAVDPDLELVVCGSSNNRMPTFGSWERDVLLRTIDVADYISCHQYFRNDGDLPRFMASGVAMDRFIDDIAATIRYVKAATRSTRDVAISFDEWNVWDWERHNAAVAGGMAWEVAPALLEDRYTAADAVVVGDMLISLLNHADIVRAASMAQLVNVIAPIMAETDGPAWRQTTFYPFADVRRSAGMTALRPSVRSDVYDATDDPHPAVACAAASNAEGELHIYLAHRDPAAPAEVRVDLSAFGGMVLQSAGLLHSEDPTAVNDALTPDRIRPAVLGTRFDEGIIALRLPAVSWAVLRLTRRTAD